MLAEDRPPAECLDRRRAGILLHITSLPGGGTCGDLGQTARNFVNCLGDCGFSVWQMLPVAPTFDDNSPYQTRSVHAGNPRLIDLEALVAQGWLDEVPALAPHDGDTVKAEALEQAWRGFATCAKAEDRARLDTFVSEHRFWLDDYALFRALTEAHGPGWWHWPKPLRHRDSAAMDKARAELAERLDYIAFEQFVFFEQWDGLRTYANGRGVKLFGDMPIFVAHDSAEVWARPQDFDLNPDGTLRVVAGVPPDYFAAEGQRWGNPLYRWDAMRDDGFRFWIDRIRTAMELFDMVRIDHFRGFAACWEIPANESSAVNGHWVQSLGDELFTRLHDYFGKLPLVAEDLGTITEDVELLRKKHHMPGMKVLQFAFSGDPDNPYLPFHHDRDSVVYTGTHDNDTTLGWYNGLDDHTRWVVNEYMGWPQEAMPWPIVRQALGSRSHLAILPMQDVLCLDGDHRMNRPGTSEGNWQWRLDWGQLPSDLPKRLSEMLKMYGRFV